MCLIQIPNVSRFEYWIQTIECLSLNKSDISPMVVSKLLLYSDFKVYFYEYRKK
jgi:hypothetical protein